MNKEVINIKAMYIFLGIGMALIWVPTITAMLVSSVLFLIVLMFSRNGYKRRRSSEFYRTHYRWIIRTFWIGTAILMPIASTLLFWVATDLCDTSAFDEFFAVSTSSDLIVDLGRIQNLMAILSDPDAFDRRIWEFLSVNWLLLSFSVLFTCVPVVFWVFRRIWIGYKSLIDEDPIENVASWL